MALLERIDPRLLGALASPGATRGKRVRRALLYPATGSCADPVISQLVHAWRADPYVITSDAKTAEMLRAAHRSAQVLCVALEDVRITRASMSAVVVELPSGSTDLLFGSEDDEDAPRPSRILRRIMESIAPDGILLALIPEAALSTALWRMLTAWATPLWVGIIAGEKEDPEGLAVAARLRPASFEDLQSEKSPLSRFPLLRIPPEWLSDLSKKSVEERLRKHGWRLAPALEVPPYPVATLPALDVDEIRFSAATLSWSQAVAESTAHGLWTDASLQRQIAPDTRWAVQPLMPLTRGHLGQLIACGAFDNGRLEGPHGPVLIKGRTYKRRVETDRDKISDNEEVSTMRDAFRTTVMLLDLTSGQYQTVHTDDADDAAIP